MLRVEIDDVWEPQDFVEVLESIEALYYIAAPPITWRDDFPYPPPWRRYYGLSDPQLASYDVEALNRRHLDIARRIAPPESRVIVDQIQYASPGSVDLVGIGKACEAIAGIIDRLIKFVTEREKRKQENEQAKITTKIKRVELDERRESLRALKLKNARELLAIRSEYRDVMDEQYLALADRNQDKLLERIVDGKIVGAKNLARRKRDSE
jgi:hypothetical protein